MDFWASARTLSVKNFRSFPPPHFGNESALSLLKSDSYGIGRFSIIFGIRIGIISSQYITDKLLSIGNYFGIIGNLHKFAGAVIYPSSVLDCIEYFALDIHGYSAKFLNELWNFEFGSLERILNDFNAAAQASTKPA